MNGYDMPNLDHQIIVTVPTGRLRIQSTCSMKSFGSSSVPLYSFEAAVIKSANSHVPILKYSPVGNLVSMSPLGFMHRIQCCFGQRPHHATRSNETAIFPSFVGYCVGRQSALPIAANCPWAARG